MNQRSTRALHPAAAPRRAAGGRLCAAWAALLLLGATGPAVAASFGRPLGAPLIGRPLQLTIPVTLAPGEELTCVRAELLHGDDPAAPLPWRVERTSDGRTTLRITSTAPVMEPVVTVRLATGCAEQFVQAHVLLTELPPVRETAAAPERGEARAEPAAAPLSSAPAATAPRAARPPTTSRRAGPSVGTGTAEAATAGTAAAPAVPRRIRRPADTPPPAEPGRSSGGARLQVELLDFAIDQSSALRISNEMSAPETGALSRTEAAAAWQSLQPGAEQLAALQKQAETMLAELRLQREQTNRQSEQLQRVTAQRDLMRDILAGVAAAIALLLSVLLWRRTRLAARQAPWWQGQRPPGGPRPVQDSNFVDSSFDDAPKVPLVVPDADSSWGGISRPLGVQPAPAPRKPLGNAARSAFGDSLYGRSRLPSPEELLDVQEQANFFVAIGQADQAILLLETRLLEHLGSSPFLWLDLLDLCRKLDRRDDYERVRMEFQKVFAARLPAFGNAPVNTDGLERYPRALSRIMLLWPTSRVLKEIEKSLFEDPAPGSIMFDLEASRDLLLLYSLAQEVVHESPDGTPYDPTERVPLDSERGGLNTQPVPLMALDTGDDAEPVHVLDLDLDFSALETPRVPAAPAAAAAPELPEVPAVPIAAAPGPAPDDPPHLPDLPLDLAPTEPQPMLEPFDLGQLRLEPRPASSAATSATLDVDLDLDLPQPPAPRNR